MDKGDKDSPGSGRNIFDNAANMMGMSPFGLSFGAHLAHMPHMPSAYSLLQHHPAFPVSSLFSGISEGAFGHFPPSLTSTEGATLLQSPILSLSASPNGAPLNIAIPDSNKSETVNNSSSSKSSPSKHSPKSSKSSSRSSKLSRSSSSKTTVTKATTTLATTSTVSTSSSRPSPTTMVSGTTGVSLLSGKFKKSSKHLSSKTYTTSLLTQSTSPKSSANGTVSQSASPSPSATSSSSAAVSLSPSTKHKESLKTLENGATLYESDNPSNGSLASPCLSSDDDEDFTGNGRLGNDKDLDSNDEGGNGSMDDRNTGSPNIHIDGTKKRLIADQIRQRVQNKPIQNIKPSIMQPMKRGRGRPPKHEPTPTPQQLEVIKEYKKQQEYLKRQLEENLKQQQMQLKIMKRTQVEKEKEASAKVQKLLEASVKQARANAAAGVRDKEARQRSALSPPSHAKEASSRSSSSQGNSTLSRLDKSDVHPSTSKSSPVKSKLQSEESSGLSEDNDSDMMNESDDEDDSGINETDSDAEPRLKMVIDSEGESHESGQMNKGSKRSAEETSDKNETPIKRPRVQMDEKELKIPMDAGWRRQTTILAIGKRGFIGEVLYFAPCGKKMKTIPDVMRYVDRHSITGMGRENFSFNTKVNVGDFYETRHGHNVIVKLTNEEVVERMALVESKRQKMLRYKQQRGRKRIEKQNKQLQLAKQMMDQKLKRKMEQQEMAKRASEYKMQKKVEKDRQKDLANKVKQIKALEQKKQKEQLNLIREQEKMQRHEQMRIEREMRAQQILESNLLWYHMEREREMKRQQAVMLKEQVRFLFIERERKRQHILLVKAMEAQKKQAERDRLKEEKVVEKRMVRERKMEQKRWELQMARELKKPTEDMELRDSRPLPEFPRIPGIQTDSAAFADILMVLEFLHNFADALGYVNSDTLPSLRALQDGILGKTEEDSEDYVALVSHLLRYAISDPGVPNPKDAVTKLGQKIVDMEITDSIVSEILRIFVVARNGGSNEMSEWLSRLPLESLDHIRKAAILAFLCNELLCGKSISSEIEKHLDRMGDIRRDKWVVEGKLRRLRVLQAKKFHRPVPKPVVDQDTSTQGGEGDESQNTSGKRCSDDDEEKEEESGNESDDDAQSGCQETDGDEEEPLSLEECDKQIEKLQKQHAQYRAKVFKSSHKLRAIMVGSDRYRRKYWVLPCAGGVYVEGLETGKSVEDEDLIEEKKDIKEEKVEIKQESDKIKEEDRMECENSKLNDNHVKEEKCIEEKTTIQTDEQDIKKEVSVVKLERKEDRNVWDTVKEEGLDRSCSFSVPTKMEINEEKNGCKSETGDAAIVTSALFPTSWKMDKHKQTTCNGEITPSTSECNNKSDCSVKTSGNIFLQSSPSSKLSDLCSNVSSTISPTKTDSKSDDSKSVVNSSLLTSPSPLITPYSSAPSLFFPPFSPSLNGALGSNPSTSSLSPGGSSPRPAHQHHKSSTPSHTEGKASFLSIDTLLKKDHSHLTSQNNHFLQSPLFPVSPDQMIKSLSSSADGSEQKPWFSILPRMPCDDLSMTQGSSPQVGLSSSPFSGGSPFFSPMSLRAFPLHSPSFSSFQMGQLYSPNNYSATTASSNTSCESPSKLTDSSFKVPLTPKVEGDSWTLGSQQQESTEALLKELQGERQPIPEEKKKSWWRVTDPDQLRTLQRHCHPRGIREKNLQKSFQKYMDYACESCSKGNKEIVSLESDSEEEEEDEEEEEEEEEEKEGDQEKKEETDKDTEDEEKLKKKKAKEGSPPPQKEWLPEIAHQVELSVLEEVENLVERVASASLQVKGWKVPSRVDDDVDLTIVDRTKLDLKENERYPLDAAREKLLSLEPNIERRYIKPPLTKAVTINLASLADHSRSERRNSHTQEEEEDNDSIDQDTPERPEDVPPGLAMWRSAVAKASSPAQLTLCVHQLSTSISWEKSIMKVLCQICRKDDNEAELLLCDGCDQGYHTYCFKPKMEMIPDGDWYCYECISKASGVPCCIVCGKKTGKIAECHHCPRAIHLDCLDPPLPRMPRKWVCPACSSNLNGRKRTRKSPKSPKKLDGGNTTPVHKRDSEPSMKAVETSSSEKKRSNKENERKKAAEQSDDMTLCRLVLTEMEKHEDGWPFLKPVNFKQFPTYRKYIKQPMDFSTVKNKLRDSVYKSRAEFAADCRLIFENCKTFNEDESEVGRGGHTLRKFFESRWKELILHSSTISSNSSSSSSAVSSSQSLTVTSSSASSISSVTSSSTVAPPLSGSSSGTVSGSSVSETKAEKDQ
ncbi:bromodomain adjacent to zinc finger domain protein 2B-like [Ylistrum balloti]|uniref:bromodomain adjacent to zinc finger domain protein 2B-like n=1 Tax=Ylistrum balloti TaxID=509963 RepID=UPI002905B936|nr:bromodomain adjacent to zinc finger domain protein 2B-like [Ylistrum balloti]